MKAAKVHGGEDVLARISESEGGVTMTAPGIKDPLVGLDLDMTMLVSQPVVEAGLGGDNSLSGDGDGLR